LTLIRTLADGAAVFYQAAGQRVGLLAQAAGDRAAVAGEAQHAVLQLHHADVPGQRRRQRAFERRLGGEQRAGAHRQAVRQLAGEQVGEAAGAHAGAADASQEACNTGRRHGTLATLC
jgi:hypothetical protein